MKRVVKNTIHNMNTETDSMLRDVLTECEANAWGYSELRRQIGLVFNSERSKSYSRTIINDVSTTVMAAVRNQCTKESEKFIESKTKRRV